MSNFTANDVLHMIENDWEVGEVICNGSDDEFDFDDDMEENEQDEAIVFDEPLIQDIDRLAELNVLL